MPAQFSKLVFFVIQLPGNEKSNVNGKFLEFCSQKNLFVRFCFGYLFLMICIRRIDEKAALWSSW
jgi:hypothetical protein